MAYRPLKIGEVTAQLPIVQGGMGVGVSLSGLAGAVAACGGIGTISAANIGYNFEGFYENPIKTNLTALKHHIGKARESAKGGVIAVNIMTVTNRYTDYVKCACESGADLIVSGAGLPINLPELVQGSKTKIAPIISSLKAAKILLKMWEKRYGATADMIVIEGPEAGGHLGFKADEVEERILDFKDEIKQIIAYIKETEEKFEKTIPIVFGGGIWSGNDFRDYMDLGLDGLQVASRFVPTAECDAAPSFKDAYIQLKAEDISIIKSPVGLPGRAVRNEFIRGLENTAAEKGRCLACMGKCNREHIPYCISHALINSVSGNTAQGLIFCGAKSYRATKITTVSEVVNSLMGDDGNQG